MKRLLASKITPYYDCKTAVILSIDKDNYKNVASAIKQDYRTIHKKFTINSIRFEFSREFIDILVSMDIIVGSDENNDNFVEIKCYLDNLNNTNLMDYYQFQFRLDKDKKVVHFWDDINYIMENLVEKLSYLRNKEDLYRVAYSRIPITQQTHNLTKLTLGRI